MITHQSFTKLATLCAALFGLAAVPHTIACSPCPEPRPFQSGEYVVAEWIDGEVEPLQQWIIDRAVGARLTVDSEAGEATLRYTHEGTTYDVRFALD